MSGVNIVYTGLYHPRNYKDNDWFINHYKQQGIDINGLLNALGQKKRYQIDNEYENTLTMAIAASQAALQHAGWQARCLDLIIFTSQTPEYLIPATALKIHHALSAGERTLSYDMNANCAGLLIAVEQVSRIMMSSSSRQRALVVGGDYLGPHSHNNPVYHSCFADSAVAVLLEKVDTKNGVIDAEFRIQTSVIDNSLFPCVGLSAINREKSSSGVRFKPFDDSVCVDVACESINDLLTRNHLIVDDIHHWFLSQFSLANIRKISHKLNLDESKVPFIGGQFGYTATNSPLLAFHQTLQEKKISRGDNLMFWTIGAGWQSAAILVKY